MRLDRFRSFLKTFLFEEKRKSMRQKTKRLINERVEKTHLRPVSNRSDTIPNKVLKFVVRVRLTADKIRILDERDEVLRKFDRESTKRKRRRALKNEKWKTNHPGVFI